MLSAACCPLHVVGYILHAKCCMLRGAPVWRNRVECAVEVLANLRVAQPTPPCAPTTSAPELCPPLPHLLHDWAHSCNIRTWTGLNPATSAPGLGSPRPHLHRDWVHPAHICTVTSTCQLRPSNDVGLEREVPRATLYAVWTHREHLRSIWVSDIHGHLSIDGWMDGWTGEDGWMDGHGWMGAVYGRIRRKEQPSRAQPSFPILRTPSTSTPVGIASDLAAQRARIPKDIRVLQYYPHYRQVPPLQPRPPAAASPVPRSRCGWGEPSPGADVAPPDKSRRYRRRRLARR